MGVGLGGRRPGFGPEQAKAYCNWNVCFPEGRGMGGKTKRDVSGGDKSKYERGAGGGKRREVGL